MKELIPITGFNVISIIEDLDCVTPNPDYHKVLFNEDSLAKAIVLAKKHDHVFSRTYIIDNLGKTYNKYE